MHQVNPLVSIIVPVYNEESNIRWFFDNLKNIKNDFVNFEYIFINDGSTDNSEIEIKKICKENKIRYINFSRNFGKEAATSAGLMAANGDAAIMIDADGQHPIELINKFIDEWQNGFEVIIGVRKSNTHEGLVKSLGSKLFYALLRIITGTKTVTGSTDFRLVDRKVILEFNKLTEHNRMTRGLIDWLGFKRTFIEFTSPARHSGSAAYSNRKLIRLAMHGFVSQTTKPLQFTGLLGFFVTLSSLLMAIFIIFEQYIFNDPFDLHVTGTAILAIFLSFLLGLVLICQWLLALYVESIHSEAQNRPIYVISEKSE